jgi:hypothetical protein
MQAFTEQLNKACFWEIDPKTLNFVSLLLHIPKTRFKCHIKKQLINQPWSINRNPAKTVSEGKYKPDSG